MLLEDMNIIFQIEVIHLIWKVERSLNRRCARSITGWRY